VEEKRKQNTVLIENRKTKIEKRNSKNETRNSKLETRNSKLETRNSKLEKRNSIGFLLGCVLRLGVLFCSAGRAEILRFAQDDRRFCVALLVLFSSAARAEILRCAKDDRYSVVAVFIVRFSVTEFVFRSFDFLLQA
jgi:hypothetical protein